MMTKLYRVWVAGKPISTGVDVRAETGIQAMLVAAEAFDWDCATLAAWQVPTVIDIAGQHEAFCRAAAIAKATEV